MNAQFVVMKSRFQTEKSTKRGIAMSSGGAASGRKGSVYERELARRGLQSVEVANNG